MIKLRLARALFTVLLIAPIGQAASGGQPLPSGLDVSFEGEERKFGARTIPSALFLPPAHSGRVPLIISQHGSSRDGTSFADGQGKTDEYSTRIVREGTQAGFAVAVLDAFAGTGLRPNNKRKFPDAARYAVQLHEALRQHPRIDSDNVFYTGFSYGAAQVLKQQGARWAPVNSPWRALAAAEPGCNVVSLPASVPYATLIIKGGESHYGPAPCEYYIDMIATAGNQVEYWLLPGANHFFSANGEIVDGTAVNGCADNPVIRYPDGRRKFADGTVATRELFVSRCITRQGGKGKSREYLDEVVRGVIAFFERQRR